MVLSIKTFPIVIIVGNDNSAARGSEPSVGSRIKRVPAYRNENRVDVAAKQLSDVYLFESRSRCKTSGRLYRVNVYPFALSTPVPISYPNIPHYPFVAGDVPNLAEKCMNDLSLSNGEEIE